MKYKIGIVLFAIFLMIFMGGSTSGLLTAEIRVQKEEGKQKKEEAEKTSKKEEKAAAAATPTPKPLVTPSIVDSKEMYCRGIGTNQIAVGAEIREKVESVDDYYYLMRYDSISEKMYPEALQKQRKSTKMQFRLSTEKKPHLVLARYCIAVKTEKGFERISPLCYVENPETLAQNQAPYEVAETKKGIQGLDLEDILKTGTKQVFLNITASHLLSSSDGTFKYTYDGEVYVFSALNSYRDLIKVCNKKGIVVTAQILLDDVDESLIIPEGRKKGESYYAWNTREAEPRKKMEAMFSYLAAVFGKEECYVTNWILGNEVNSCNAWNYCGNLPKSTYVAIYSEAFRSLYNAVRARKASSKVFICLDHNWNLSPEGYSSKEMLDRFAEVIGSIQLNVQWNVAYHAYPTPLTEIAFWENLNIQDDVNSPVIHMRNLDVLTDYIRENYGSQTRILLSEQGFTSKQGEDLQAAALAYAYYIAAANPMVDGFLIRSFEDNFIESAVGLMMGIKNKQAHNVYTYMDTKEGMAYTQPYLIKTDLKSWTEIPGFTEEKAYTNYRED